MCSDLPNARSAEEVRLGVPTRLCDAPSEEVAAAAATGVLAAGRACWIDESCPADLCRITDLGVPASALLCWCCLTLNDWARPTGLKFDNTLFSSTFDNSLLSSIEAEIEDGISEGEKATTDPLLLLGEGRLKPVTEPDIVVAGID